MARARETHTKHPGEALNLAINCARLLDDGERFTGTPAFTSDPAGLTFSSPQANAAAVTVRGVVVPAGKALMARASGGSHGVEYACTATCPTDASPAQTVVVTFRLLVSDE